MKNPLISIIIPVKNTTHYLRDENLPAFVAQTYKNFEVIVLPNHASEEDKKLLSKYPWLTIIPTGKVSRPAEKRDIGAGRAKGTILAFIDDDAYPSGDWLEQSIHCFDSKKTEVVCGPGIIPPSTNIWEKIFDEILKSPVGSGGYQYRFVQGRPKLVDDYPSVNFLIRKDVFEKLGGFNNDYWPGEDSKLCEDLVYKYKGKMYYSPRVMVYHHRRNSLTGYLKQHANYGFHRGAFFAHGDRNSRQLSYLVPSLFVFYLFILPFSLFLNYHPILVLIPIGGYVLLGLFLISQSLLHTKNVVLSFATFPVLLLTHVVYGTMFMKGFIKGLFKKKHIYG
ncbi:MAG: glycosyltransferase [bacterium]